jgi:putative transposase
MPNHCHVLVEPFGGVPLWKIVLSWKNYTARLINQLRRRTGERRADGCAEVWRREFWDRYIRDEAHFEAVREYIAMNPVRAGLVSCPQQWSWSSCSCRMAESSSFCAEQP